MLFSSLLLGGCALVAGILELSPRAGETQNEVQAYRALAVAPPPLALSTEVQQLGLVRCADALISVSHRTQPASLREAVQDNCEDFARSALDANPVHSLAWYVLALVTSERGSVDAFIESLRRSQATAPAEQWLARQRVDLAERMRPDVAGDALTFMDADLALMVQSSTGVTAIADRYVAQPDFRERITEVVENLPEEDQARFVGWVAAAVRNRER